MKKDIETYSPATQQQWRNWLKKNHQSKQSIWVIIYKKNAGTPTVTYGEAVEEALCFGWIDGTRKSIDDKRSMQYFSKRKTKSNWSKINKGKVKRLIDEGLMTKAGYEAIEAAKKNGTWSLLDGVEELEIPKDLGSAFRSHAGSKAYFNSLSKSVKKMILQWVVMAKRPGTRQKRIVEIVEQAAQKQKPKQFR